MSSLDHPHVPEDGLINLTQSGSATATIEDDRPPVCPRCQKRLVILATHAATDDEGRSHRRQLWGCPKGHATVYRIGGVFTGFELLPDMNP